MRVALLITCYNDTLFPGTGQAVVRELERLGHTVEFPAGQTCCGQMHWIRATGGGAPMVARFVRQFQGAGAVVVPNSSCVTMMRERYVQMAARLARESGKVGAGGGGRGAAAAGVIGFGDSDEAAGAQGRGGLLSAPGDVPRELPWAARAGLGGGRWNRRGRCAD